MLFGDVECKRRKSAEEMVSWHLAIARQMSGGLGVSYNSGVQENEGTEEGKRRKSTSSEFKPTENDWKGKEEAIAPVVVYLCREKRTNIDSSLCG